MDIMKMGKNPNYLGSWDLEDSPNREITLTIKKIVDETVTTAQKSELCTVCYWVEDYKPMILNITNKKTLCKLYSTKDTDKLAGNRVIIGISQVKAFGDVFDALRIRKKRPAPPKNTVYKCADCGNTITGLDRYTADQIAMITQQRYGVTLCSDCSSKRKSANQSTNNPTQQASQEADNYDTNQ